MPAKSAKVLRLIVSQRRRFEKVLGLGAKSDPDKQSRRLMLINLASFSAAMSSATYASVFAFYDPELLMPMIVGNLCVILMYCATPLWHRFGVNAAAIVFTLTAYVSLFLFVVLVGPDSGIQLNYMTAGALAFVIFGSKQLSLIVVLLSLGFVLHLIVMLFFKEPLIDLSDHKPFLGSLYALSASSSMLLVAGVVWYAFQLVNEAEEQSEKLLRNILPDSIAVRLKARPTELIADRFEDASVLFADIVGFTDMCNHMQPNELITLLNEVFSRFDILALKYGVEKIKTIGDSYMAVSGIPIHNGDHAVRMVDLSIEMLDVMKGVSQSHGHHLNLRIGIASGSITAGVIGKAKFSYDVWAPTVNLAARLESSGEAGRIHICNHTKAEIGQGYLTEMAPSRHLKGIGLVTSWFVVERNSEVPKSNESN
jgi:adenylate cyclase